MRQQREGYHEEVRRYNLKKNFGLSIEEYEGMLKDQNYQCSICGVDCADVDRRFAVDHDHQTGEIRGLLCIECNRGLGAFDDSVGLLERAVSYLKKMRRSGKL